MMSPMSTPLLLQSADGTVELTPTDAPGRMRVTLRPASADLYVPQSSCDTTLPPHVIERFLARSFSHLCELLSRHEPADEIHRLLTRQLRAYEGNATLAGARILDFGCGAGASTVCLAQQYPAAEVVGVDLDPSLVADADVVLTARGLANARVLVSPAGTELPAGIGQFDIIVLSAVYEHLLPDERRVLMPMLWRAIRPGGRLYLSQTPYRYFPYEHHSTGLWFINYVPDGLAHWLARRFARLNPKANARRTWREHLRGGDSRGHGVGGPARPAAGA
jgi:cyclopropane fatty-acyl-phospholipid synthase-like methyltransferase